MPDFKLEDSEIADLVAYVNSLTPGHNVAADLEREHPASSMTGMSMGGMLMGMAMAPPARPPDQAPVNTGARGYFPGVERSDTVRGAALFSAACVACHGAAGAGGSGPQLVGLGKVDSPSYLAWKIKDHSPPLPHLALRDTQIADLAAYLETLDTRFAPAGAPLEPSSQQRGLK